MIITPTLIHYIASALVLALGALGGGAGQGIAGLSVLQAMQRQKMGMDSHFRILIIGLALIESGIIITLVVSLMILYATATPINWSQALSQLGVSLAVGSAGAATSIASSFVVKSSSEAISRQPLFANKIIPIMLLSQSIIETAIVFAFVIALLMQVALSNTSPWYEGVKFLAAGIAMALGCIGTSAGQAIFSHASCRSIGLNKNAYHQLFPFALLNQAIIETPLIFCFLMALIIIFTPFQHDKSIMHATNILVASITIGLGTIGTSIGIGFTGAQASYQIALKPAFYSIIFRTSLLIEAFIESSVIYAMIIALLLVIKVS